MTTSNATDRLELGPWQVGDVRLTAFPVLAISDPGAELKRSESLVGKKPEAAGSRNYGLEGEVVWPFIFGGKLRFQWSPGAIQWMLVPDLDRAEARFLNPQLLPPFKELMSRWVTDCPPLRRMAFGAALYLPVKGREEGYRLLRQYLPFNRDNSAQVGAFLEYSPETGDFLYQFNRRRFSESVPGVQLNRLSKWTWVPLGEVRVLDGKLVEPPESACLLELDINTAPEFQGALSHDQCARLIEEMIGLAVEIAAQGDVP